MKITLYLTILFQYFLDTSWGYQAGVGLGDMTGPASEVNMMGYASPNQNSAGIHFRLFARALVVASKDEEFHPSQNRPMAFVSMDNGMASQALRTKVLQVLAEKFPDMYTEQNLCLSGTHTHAGTAGYFQYAIFQIMSLGFVQESFDAMVDGIVESIQDAHLSAKSHISLRVTSGTLENANINRSPSAYMANPAQERAKYASNTDHEMVLLRVEDKAGKPLGMFNWFAVHGTSMPNTNQLLSGDNKGYASALFEAAIEPNTAPNEKSFVGAFCSTNLGDVSPNINGTFCSDSGLPCEELHSTCGGISETCHGRGPGSDPFESTAIIGRRQFEVAMKLFESRMTPVRGPAQFRAINRDFSNIQIENNFIRHHLSFAPTSRELGALRGAEARTCPSALGFSFAAGTTDGPGEFDFTQGDTSGNALWDFIRDFIAVPTKELEQCQHPKPILLATGEVKEPYAWHPQVLGLQMFILGRQLCIVAVPSEFTTMAGRRLKEMLRETLVRHNVLDPTDSHVVIAGLSNGYSHYVTTFEEYQVQRYEGASTLYGPWTHAAYMQELNKLAISFSSFSSSSLPVGPSTPDFIDKAISLLPSVAADEVPIGSWFGKVTQNPKATYSISAADIVEVSFQSASPRNNIRRGGSFLFIEQLQDVLGPDGVKEPTWIIVRTDGHLDTRFSWTRHGVIFEQSTATVQWHLGWADQTIPVTPGTYRIVHRGTSKHILGKLEDFEGHSEPFEIVH